MPASEFHGPPSTTLRDVRQWVADNLDAPGVICPCCTQVAARRHRHLHHSMAAALIALVRYFRVNPTEHWVHAETYFKQRPELPAQLRGDFPKLVHWGLLRARDPDTDEHAHTGEYRVTRTGYLFADGRLRVRQSGWMFNKQMLIDSESRLINIHDALNERFNYWELMGIERP